MTATSVLRNWASAYGAAVRQRTVRQKTTMARDGTLPEFLYQRHLEVGDKVHLNFGYHEGQDLNEDEDDEACKEDSDSDEGQNDFDQSCQSSDEHVDKRTLKKVTNCAG